jgi:hypothetical protein
MTYDIRHVNSVTFTVLETLIDEVTVKMTDDEH